MRRASSRPIVLFPAPIMPTRNRFAAWTMRLFYASQNANGRASPAVCQPAYCASPLADREALVDDPRRDEDEQLGLRSVRRLVPEQEPDVRQVAQERNLRDVGPVGLLVDAADHDRAAVFDEHLGLDVLGIDLHARRGR